MSGLDERPMETYSDVRKEFKCRKCNGGVVCTEVHYDENVWWWDYKCLSCGYEGRRMRTEVET